MPVKKLVKRKVIKKPLKKKVITTQTPTLINQDKFRLQVLSMCYDAVEQKSTPDSTKTDLRQIVELSNPQNPATLSVEDHRRINEMLLHYCGGMLASYGKRDTLNAAALTNNVDSIVEV